MQPIFQLGGNTGSAIGPLLVVIIVGTLRTIEYHMVCTSSFGEYSF
jgi:hypothetical protein